MFRKRLTAFFLTLVLLLALLPVTPVSADGVGVFHNVNYSEDFTTWTQTDKAWKDLRLGGSSYTMGSSGCLVTAVAMAMCTSNCYLSTQLNPGSLVEWLNKKGFLSDTGDLQYNLMTAGVSPRFYFQKRVDEDSKNYTNLSYARQQVEKLQADGYTLIARVNSPTGKKQHFVVVRYPSGTDDIAILDPGSGYTLLSKYSEYRGYLCFKTNRDAKDTIFNGAAAPVPIGNNDSGGSSTSAPVTSTPPVSGGSTVSGVAVTISYDNNWVNAGKTTQPAKSGETYHLITPYRDNAAFLGWYLDGVMVTNSSIVPARNHTLVARWDPRGFGYPSGDSYDGRFTDVESFRWYYSDMTKAFSYGLMNGVTETTFGPNDNILYDQTITLAARVNKQYYEGNTVFGTSVPWYMTFAGYAQSHGIIENLDINFAEPVSRLDFATMLSRAIPESALPEVNAVAPGSIPDVSSTEKDIYRLYRAGVLRGYEEGAFKPQDKITRAEAATLLVRLVDPNARVLFSMS